MKILVIGDGALGNSIARHTQKSEHELFQTSRKNKQLIHFDLKNEQEFTFLPKTDWAVIAAGISGYKECAESPESRIVNVEQTLKLCRNLLERGAKILFPSSTAVFDGKTTFPTPETPTSPSTEYGRQKNEVENFLLKYPEQTAIVRLTKLLERDTPLISSWLNDLATGKTITPFNDRSIAPVLFEDAALACCRIMEYGNGGVFHCSGPQEISYLEFAHMVCKRSGFDSNLIKPASCNDFLDYCPVHCGLETSATEKLIQFKFPAPEQVIAKLLQPRCLLCGSSKLYSFEQFKGFPGITSDCKPWDRSGEFMLCKECGLAQKKLSAKWFADINEIYSGYEMYPLSAGSEPLIFDNNGTGTPRSGVLLDKLIAALSLPEKGQMLDVGCGNGSLLQQFHLRRPKWKLSGHEQSAQREEILHLPGVEAFYSGALDKIDRKFDLITMTYVIEHLTNPVSVLKQLIGLLREDGQLMIHTSSFENNPFDLMVCDHCSHFTPGTLEFLATQAGLKITGRTDQWLAKEIGFTARKGLTHQPPIRVENNLQSMNNSLGWLNQLRRKAKQLCAKQKVGIFGTAVAGTWLAASLDEASFFVDEDSSKQGQTHMDLPIITPDNIPQGAAVIMGFNKELGTRIVRRLNNCYPHINFIIPD
ncbi:sugar nucleotide-binding protein [Desulfovibrio sp. JC022]|uniref:sugar nucleotide-binding protein n=1 Tax=Desulfovibrio sp. JC022 TaxID=2593642 RepID=UPI0013D7C8E4|nr:sugar nucleotide-binding protein [Desulfovibrio sp. JC022]NDV23229.1 sugar nucleotide-binding protein [Desulfovibrio sp. JC022]